ncbi:lytic murein transglycosylase B [Roseivirga misakiensis]|uniref:Lytic murein transglycosylase B n=1 Tax=Roseivirga misakiensis TaxID=1563681 RepID=A0A1E5SLK2_9BACT|nr:lytic murein transglycosylase B [Roseivirga misakiensis]OEJ99999.1 lytic murein transglycosylase B [Roseivirga misakiensis]
MQKTLVTLLLILLSLPSFSQIDKADVEAFASEFVKKETQFSKDEVMAILNQAEYQSEIIEKITRPAEGTMTWERYRKIFIKQGRIDAGVAFYKTHKTALEKVSADTGVPAEIILGIIGVETYFGKIKGSYKVLDALYTLGFGYPKRAKFFKSELGKFLILSKLENLEATEILGSYAGAMGYSQFMPSSYIAYAKSFEENGTRDLMESPEDAIASVANYLKVHRWKKGQPITSKAEMTRKITGLRKQSTKPKNKVSDYTAIGFKPAENLNADLPATMLIFDKDGNTEHWFGLYNFYVITRYNRSHLYAMAVYQLAEEIKKSI